METIVNSILGGAIAFTFAVQLFLIAQLFEIKGKLEAHLTHRRPGAIDGN